MTIISNFYGLFLGSSPEWYKKTIIGCLLINPILLYFLNGIGANGSFIVGWILLLEFIFTLALALKCYPLQPGGLLAIQAILMGLTNPDSIYYEVEHNLQVVLLLVFMVAGIYFMKNLMLVIFTKLLLKVHSKTKLSLLFCFVAAFLSAFLDALTVTAVLITVIIGFYRVFHLAMSNFGFDKVDHNISDDTYLSNKGLEELDNFKSFLRDLVMHGVVGTALGGVCTIVGEPQNLLIAHVAGWEFMDFLHKMSPVTVPVFITGLALCVTLEKLRLFSYGTHLPTEIKEIFLAFDKYEEARQTPQYQTRLYIEIIVGLLLILALAFHVAEVGIIGLGVIVLLTAFKGITDEHDIGPAFNEALPFTALLVVFFAIVSVIHEQNLFIPVVNFVFAHPIEVQAPMFYLANGVLSAISDNVFVATVYISEIKDALDSGLITREHFDHLAIAVNTGTNIPSVATPNGQAAFLFLLTSSAAPLINLSYMRMVYMALPYTVVLTIVGFIAVSAMF
ncbi:MAG: sodium/proton antiporter NhaB [Gammaproteobacteria bacterium]